MHAARADTSVALFTSPSSTSLPHFQRVINVLSRAISPFSSIGWRASCTWLSALLLCFCLVLTGTATLSGRKDVKAGKMSHSKFLATISDIVGETLTGRALAGTASLVYDVLTKAELDGVSAGECVDVCMCLEYVH